jgi:hypothetical protein
MTSIVSGMKKFINAATPRVPNPVNPDEDFADRWDMDEGKRLSLEKNFKDWLQAAENDFGMLNSSSDPVVLQKTASAKFKVLLNEETSKAIAQSNGLLAKAAMINGGARTTSAGIIGVIGVPNPPHKFFG